MLDNKGIQLNKDDSENEDDILRRNLRERKKFLRLLDYDSIGFDLDHTLCRYNLGPMIRLEYQLLADFLVEKRGYDSSIRHRDFQEDRDFVCKGLTLDIERGNLLRLGGEGVVLAASHGTRRMTDEEIEKCYGRNRRNHVAGEYATHLMKHGPLGMGEFGLSLHSFMDYFDYPTILLCARLVDVLDQINNQGKPMQEYSFWPDVLDGLKEMFTRTQFKQHLGGYFPMIKSHPEKLILKRSPEFRSWLKMLRKNGKFLYVITGSHVDFASHVASYALGEDWMDLFDMVIFFARKPSFFIDRRPFLRLSGDLETDSVSGWDELETGQFYSQGNWHDLNQFLEYATEWEPSASLYFGDNILQDILAPFKFTKSCHSVAVSEELLAEGMVGYPACHPAKEDLVSSQWGSYFYHPQPLKLKGAKVLSRASSFDKRHNSPSSELELSGRSCPRNSEMKRTRDLRRVSSLREPTSGVLTAKPPVQKVPSPLSCKPSKHSSPINIEERDCPSPEGRGRDRDTPVKEVGNPGGSRTPSKESLDSLETGVQRVNTLWGQAIKKCAKMCIPDLEVLIDYPIEYKFPIFSTDESGECDQSGFFPADPISLHHKKPSPSPLR